jgi:hypothetical protein
MEADCGFELEMDLAEAKVFLEQERELACA